MYLEKIKWAYENPTAAYAHNNVCVGLDGILKEYKMEPDVRQELTSYYKQLSPLSYYNHWTHTVDEIKFRKFNRLTYELFHYLERFTFS